MITYKYSVTSADCRPPALRRKSTYFLQRIVHYIMTLSKSIVRHIDIAKTEISDLIISDPNFSLTDIVQQIIDDFGDCRLMFYFVWRSFNDKTFIWVSDLNIT